MSLEFNAQKIQTYAAYSHDHVAYVRALHMTWTFEQIIWKVLGVCVLMFGCFMLMFVDLVEQSRGRGVINCS